MNNIYQAMPLESINANFFARVVLASLEIIKVLDTRHAILYQHFGVGAGGDISSGADLIAEAIFCKFLSPYYHIDSEETGFIHGDINACETIILDPLDGSNNFKSNIPYYGASLALCDEYGKVKEAVVVNYISHEIVYSNDKLLQKSKIPFVFYLSSIATYATLKNYSNIVDTSKMKYFLIDLSDLLYSIEMNIDLNYEQKSNLINGICSNIISTRDDAFNFDVSFLQDLFTHSVVSYIPHQMYSDYVCKCSVGIFEKASHYYKWAKFLHSKNLKFRSLGATALSIAFSFRYLFVLLPTNVRKYDGMAGFYLAQNQNMYGNVSDYLDSIPFLEKYNADAKHVIISNDFNIINSFTRS